LVVECRVDNGVVRLNIHLVQVCFESKNKLGHLDEVR